MKWDASKPRTENSSGGAGNHASLSPTEEAIRRRAFEIFLARGGKGGDSLADWLQAERELRAGLKPSAGAESKPSTPQRSAPARPSPVTQRI